FTAVTVIHRFRIDRRDYSLMRHRRIPSSFLIAVLFYFGAAAADVFPPQNAAPPSDIERRALTPANQVLEIPLTEVFRGCWRGQVDEVDSKQMLRGWRPAFLVYWIPKAYEVCLLRRGLEPWVLTWSESKLGPHWPWIQESADSLRVIRGTRDDE